MSAASLCTRTAVAVTVFAAAAAQAKPPTALKDEKKPASAEHLDAGSFLRWLLLQNGGPDAISVPWPELVRAATGKQVTALDAADAAFTAKLGAALNQTLPRLNRPDATLRADTILTSTETAARVANALRVALSAAGGLTVSDPAEPSGSTYPAVRCVDAASGRNYCLSIALYPSGGREGALPALTFRAAEGAGRIDADGCCLLVALEDNGKTGRDLALLNWELIDLAKVSVRCAVGFEADENAVHQPGAMVTDGRKGRD